MGLSNSKSRKNKDEINLEDFVRAKQMAYKQYVYRVKTYNPDIHGPKYIYMLEVEAEYESNLIPAYLQYNFDKER